MITRVIDWILSLVTRTISLEDARRWCSQAHGEQTYGDIDPKPYGASHLASVESVARRFGFHSRIILMACWVHDVLEDTKKTVDDLIKARFPKRVIQIAQALTDEPGANRSERKLKTYPKIRRDRLAIVVKLCDRIANVEFSLHDDQEKHRMYINEYAAFKEHLYDPRDKRVAPMWRHLDNLLGA